ncbi:cytochrome P450 [Trichoderma asperelloides]|nr:cytochrome P450 [Trichoderma asperelloides]
MMTQSLESFKTINLSGIWLIAAAIYIVSFIIYRLYFHPLSGIPGPRLAAITSWYETYYDLFKTPSGQYWNKLDELHKEYGPIIRINPDEIQIHDPEFYSQIYAGGATKRHRYARSVSGNGSPGSMASAVSHDLHRLRRSSLNPFFSRSAVLRLEERIQSRVRILCERLSSFLQRGEIVDMSVAMTSLTLDIITEYSFGESWNLMDSDDLSYNFIKVMRGGFETLQVRKLFNSAIRLVPPSILAWSSPNMKVFLEFKDVLPYSRLLPEEEIETQRLADEALVLITAGSETTSRALATIIYHVLRNPHILSNLRQELDAAIPDANMEVPYLALEALPYLSATIRESLRISALVPNRSLLTADEPLQYKQWSLKPGTAFCMNTSKYLLDASIYNNPTMFDPERWLGDTQRTQKLLHHFAPFSKGHRGCIGMNLAYAELYLVSAYIIRRFDMRLYDVIRERDVDTVRDAFIGLPSIESKGVRVEIIRKRN